MDEIIMKLIMASGDAKADIMEAIKEARKKNFTRAYELLDTANIKIIDIHRLQTSIMSRECSGEKIEFSIMFVHAQDHLTSALVTYDLAKELIGFMEDTNR